MSIRDRVQSGTGDEDSTIHTDGSLWYRGRVMVPQLIDLREESSESSIALDFLCIKAAKSPLRRWV